MKLKMTKLKQHVMPTYLHTDSTDVIENDFIYVMFSFNLNFIRIVKKIEI
jgi:hypothetical protein